MDNYIIYPKQLRKQSIPVEKNRCFFLMPFNEEFDEIYGEIKRSLTDAEFICNRADDIAGSTPILTKILTEIMRSQYIIADLTNSNPNVFYELGIAHTIKEARNVLLLKQKKYDVPFDIRHLTYTEYEPDNLKLLTSSIRKFLNANKSKNAFYEALNLHGIINFIDENENDFIEILIKKLDESIIGNLTKILSYESNELSDLEIEKITLSLKRTIDSTIREKNYDVLFKIIDIYYETIISLRESKDIQKQVSDILGDYFEQFSISDAEIIEFKTKLALMLAKKEMYMNVVLPWILNYFSRSKTATIDLNRYNLESFLMTSKSERVNQAIINGLCDKDCYVREHMSDMIGEKNLSEASSLLCIQLKKEENYFTAQSMMEAIGKIGNPEGIDAINDWIKKHKDEVIQSNQLFVLKHAYIAISKLDKTSDKRYIGSFQNDFGEILRDYYII